MEPINSQHQDRIGLHIAVILQLYADRRQIVVTGEDITAAVIVLLSLRTRTMKLWLPSPGRPLGHENSQRSGVDGGLEFSMAAVVGADDGVYFDHVGHWNYVEVILGWRQAEVGMVSVEQIEWWPSEAPPRGIVDRGGNFRCYWGKIPSL